MTSSIDQDQGLGASELRVAIQRGLLAELGDTYDCTRVWSAWSYGTMDENDFVPVLDRLDALIDTILAEITAIPATTGGTEAPREQYNEGICTIPPEGWWCSRKPGHDGPCAARQLEQPYEGPLTDADKAKIDQAWEIHKSAVQS